MQHRLVFLVTVSLGTITLASLSGCEKPGAENPLPTAAGETCINGELVSNEGACSTFRAVDGDFYALVGQVDPLEAGRNVCVCGPPAAYSMCGPRTTLAVTRVETTCPVQWRTAPPAPREPMSMQDPPERILPQSMEQRQPWQPPELSSPIYR